MLIHNQSEKEKKIQLGFVIATRQRMYLDISEGL